MAFSVSVADRISFGNLKLVILNVTDAQSAGSTYTMGWQTVHAVKGVNNTDSSDTFKEAIGAPTAASTRNQFTLTPATDDDDGQVWVFGR